MAPITAKFEADFASFYDAAKQAVIELDSMEKGAAKAETRLQGMADRFSGEKVIQQAQLMTEAVERLGGVSTLTEKELVQVGRVTNEAVEKMRALGMDVPKGMQDIANATKGAGAATESLGVSVSTLVASYVTYEAAIKLVTGAYDLLVGGMKAAIASASEAEEADAALLAALKAQGTAVPSVVAAYDAYAVALQQTTVYSDDAVKAAEAVLVQIGGVMPRDMEKALQATTNLAAGLRIDLASAATMVAKAAEGQTTALQKAGVQIEKSKGETVAFGTVLDTINTKFAGAATAAGDTFAGGLAKLDNAWDNVLESAGRALTQNATWQTAIAGLTNLVSTNTGELNKNAAANKLISEAVILVAKGMSLAVEGLDYFQEELHKATITTDYLSIGMFHFYELLQKIEIATQKPIALLGGTEAIARVKEAQDALVWAGGAIQGLRDHQKEAEQSSKDWSATLQTFRGEIDTLVVSLEATRGKTVEVAAAQAESTDVWERQTGAITAQTMAAQEHQMAFDAMSKTYQKIGTDVTALAKATEDAAYKQAVALNTVPPAADDAGESMLRFTDEVTVHAEAATGALSTMVGVTGQIAAAGAEASAAWAMDQWTLSQNYVDWLTSGVGSVPRGALGGLPMGVQGFMAAGGPVSAGSSYVVGERGPELFTPGASGLITPNGGGGGVGRVVLEAGAITIQYPILNNPQALDALARTVGDAILSKLTRTGARL